jgi:nicotinate-nucleotide pyrophosphorylase (carboxylating)
MIDQVSLALIRLALQEDLAGFGDVTTEFTVPAGTSARGTIGARQELVASGLPLAAAVLREVDPTAGFTSVAQEGALVAPGSILAEVEGSARSLLTAERTMLNLLARLCAVATQSRRFADAVAGTGAVVIDTRKTTPGLRFWEKRAVRHGGCGNHRFGLFDMVLIKDNHLTAGGGVERAVSAARAQASLGMKVEVEVAEEEGLRAAIAAGADVVMLDNIGLDELPRLVGIARGLRPGLLLEASGTVRIDTVRVVAETGVDLISTSALTVGAPPVDIGLDFE